jgi:hypothetical protein
MTSEEAQTVSTHMKASNTVNFSSVGIQSESWLWYLDVLTANFRGFPRPENLGR